MNFLKELKDGFGEVLKKDNVKRISISDSYFEVEFFDKKEKTLKVRSDLKLNKDYSDTNALDKLYEQPPTKAELDAELEERNRKLRERFSNQGNVMPSDGVAVWTGE